MRVRRLLVLLGMTLVLAMGVASAAGAADYPPTTLKILGSSVPATTAPGQTHANAAATGGLPFTGSDSSSLVWVGVALLGTGTFAAWHFGRRARAS